MARDNGGPAFPIVGFEGPNGQVTWPEYGMSLHTYIATNIMQSLIISAGASPENIKVLYDVSAERNQTVAESLAHGACDYADALIAVLNKRENADG